MTHTTTAPPNLLPALRELAAQSRQITELNWERERAERIAHERRSAVESAAAYVRLHFPATLAHVVTEDAWVGYRTLDESETESPFTVQACAVAWLGDGVWLHHTEVNDAHIGVRTGHLTLWAPCACGNFREHEIEDEYVLAEALDHIHGTADTCVGTCAPSSLHTDPGDEDL
ncbi:hypothetical protein [Streptomyces sp. 7N604]|uniref:hypothetical protein n=1 Tax=Streptomyces sp. 7N604 TaxID=3457415 RepID=UPI003FD3055B